MTEEMTAHKPRRVKRAALLTAAIAASLCVSVGVANAATGGALAEAIEFHISEVFHVNDYKIAMETEEGANVIVYGTNVDLVQEDGRVLLTAGENTIDITEDLARDGAYTYENTDGDTTLRVEVTPDPTHEGEWQYAITYIDPTLEGADNTHAKFQLGQLPHTDTAPEDGGAVTYSSVGTTAEDDGTDVKVQMEDGSDMGDFSIVTG